MKFSDAIDAYVADMQTEGKLRSESSERAYRDALRVHADDVGWADATATGRGDVKRTLGRWPNPNTQRTRRAILISFYDWMMQEGLRLDNPARQTRPPREQPAQVYRLTYPEVVRLLLEARGPRERRVIYIGICAGLRRREIRGLQGLHFSRRPGFIWVSPDIAKGGRERWEPIIKDLEPVVAEIQENVEPDHYIIPAQQFADPGWLGNKKMQDYPDQPCDLKTIWRIVRRVAKRAGIVAPVGPHTLRHAFADHIARETGDVRTAQLLLGHADLATTQKYLGGRTLDELAAAVKDVSFL